MTEKIPSKRGIYLLPSVLTTFGMFAGFYSIISSINGDFTIAAISILIAMFWDTLDGRVARLTNTQSVFGAEYDSLADLVSFGLAPALLVYQWTLYELGRFGWLAAFVYLACAALRLARFNTQVGIADKRYFQGLPSPAAAGVIASMIWLKIWTFASFDSDVISLESLDETSYSMSPRLILSPSTENFLKRRLFTISWQNAFCSSSENSSMKK